MPKLYLLEHPTHTTYYFYCPGCKHAHGLPIKANAGPTWTFDGNVQQPTFNPSLVCFYRRTPDGGVAGGQNERVTTCHLYLHGGQIKFLDDCPHELKGKTVDMVEFPPDYGLPKGAVPLS